MKLKTLIYALIGVLMLTACGESKKHPNGAHRHRASLLTPVSSGNPYEVMVVAEDSVWQGYAGKALQTILDKPLRGLPQREPQFHKSHVTEKHYDKITNLFRNVIRLIISDDYTHSKMRVEKDVHSTPQIIITIQGCDPVDVSQYITEHTKDIESLITAEEINREVYDLEYEHNIKFADAVREKFGCEFYIPVDLKKMKQGEDFIWASDDGDRVIQNICIYSLPYVSEKMFTRSPYIALRNKVMQENIPGSAPGQYMTTNADYVWTKNISVGGEYAMEARGLWEVKGDAMGGPFVSHSRIDTVNNRVIVVEGFVFAPEKMKRTLIRRLEGALYTLKTPGQIND